MKRSQHNTVMVSMIGIGIGLTLARGWLSTAGDFVRSKVSKGPDTAPPTVGGNGGSGFVPNTPSGQGGGGGGGGSW